MIGSDLLHGDGILLTEDQPTAPAQAPEQPTVAGSIFLLLLALFVNALGRRFGLFKIEREPNLEPLTLRYFVIPFAIYFAFSLALFPLIFLALGLFLHGNFLYYQNVAISERLLIQLGMVGSIAIAEAIFLARIPKPIREIILFRKSSVKVRLKNLGVGVLSWLVAYPTTLFVNAIVGALVFALFGKQGIEQGAVKELRLLLSSPLLFTLAALFVALVIPFIEELLFRGVLLRYLERRLGHVLAIVLSSAIFSLMHFAANQGVGNFQLLTSLFVLGCYLGIVYVREASLLASYALHATFNAVTILLLLL